MKEKKPLFIIFVAVSGLVLAETLYFYDRMPSSNSALPVSVKLRPTSIPTSFVHSHCLGDDEYADFPAVNKDIPVPAFAPTTTVPVSIYSKTSLRGGGFEVSNVSTNYHALELHRCGVYAVREFNYDRTISEQAIGYKQELWLYSYDGQKKC